MKHPPNPTKKAALEALTRVSTLAMRSVEHDHKPGVFEGVSAARERLEDARERVTDDVRIIGEFLHFREGALADLVASLEVTEDAPPPAGVEEPRKAPRRDSTVPPPAGAEEPRKAPRRDSTVPPPAGAEEPRKAPRRDSTVPPPAEDEDCLPCKAAAAAGNVTPDDDDEDDDTYFAEDDTVDFD